MPNAIDIQHIGKSYDGHVAVKDLSLQVPEGSVYGLLGPNGAGKTTTIRMILDIIRPDKGTISLFGQPSTDPKVRDTVGYLPEERGLYKKMQVKRMLMFLAELKGVKAVAWIDSPAPLKSGWAWGQQYLDQAVEIIEAPLGKGHVVLFGPEIAWRAQPHGTFKFLFNGIYLR